jgi:hypothetical protein
MVFLLLRLFSLTYADTPLRSETNLVLEKRFSFSRAALRLWAFLIGEGARDLVFFSRGFLVLRWVKGYGDVDGRWFGGLRDCLREIVEFGFGLTALEFGFLLGFLLLSCFLNAADTSYLEEWF